MAKLVINGKLFRDSLKMHSMKIVPVAVVAGAMLVGHASAATEDFSFINDTLQGVGQAVLGVVPLVGEIVTVGGPVIVKTAVYACVAAPFVYVALKLTKHL